MIVFEQSVTDLCIRLFPSLVPSLVQLEEQEKKDAKEKQDKKDKKDAKKAAKDKKVPPGPYCYVDARGQRQGPFDINQLRGFFASNIVTAGTHVFCAGETNEASLSSKPQLLAAAKEEQEPKPPGWPVEPAISPKRELSAAVGEAAEKKDAKKDGKAVEKKEDDTACKRPPGWVEPTSGEFCW